MARKEKLTLDYFPHYAVQGDNSKIIQERYGNDGYAVLYKNYEEFCLRDRQYIDLSEYATLASISAYCKVSEEKYLEIVEMLVKLGTYDKEVWETCNILISESFIENTKDAYVKRKGEKINFAVLKDFFLQKYTSKCISSDGNTQSKLKETKLKEIKENKVVVSNQKIEIESNNDYFTTGGADNKSRQQVLMISPEFEKTEMESGNQTTTMNFSKPSFEEVSAYCQQRNNNIDVQYFFDYYESRNWQLANNLPMEDWRAAIRIWERNERKREKTLTGGGISSAQRLDCKSNLPVYPEITEEDQEQSKKIMEEVRQRHPQIRRIYESNTKQKSMRLS